jgi:hypothetical protein
VTYLYVLANRVMSPRCPAQECKSIGGSSANHIIFACSLARFMWSVVRHLLGCNWSPANFPQFFAIVDNFMGSHRRMVWTLFAAQSWALWLTRNKLSIESKLIRNPADIIYKTLVFLQLWTPTTSARDQPSLRWMISELKQLHAANVSSD